MSSIPSVFQNFSCSYTVQNPNPTVPGNWDFDLFYFAHPYMIGALRAVDAANTVHWSPILNPHIPGTTQQDKLTFVYEEWERYRLGYLGVTGYHDAAALSNNGLLAVAQYQQAPANVHIDDNRTATDSFDINRLAEAWPSVPKTFDELQNLPNAYFGVARDGCYAPYRLSEVCQDWCSAKETVKVLGPTEVAALLGRVGNTPLLPQGPADAPYGIRNHGTTGTVCLHRRSDTGVIHISGRQFASTAAFTTYYRSGWEI